MSLTFPLSLAVFADTLKVATDSFDLGDAALQMETGGGQIIGAAHGTQLWQGSLNLTTAYHRDQSRVEALVQALRIPGRRFEIGDSRHPYPAADPLGAIIAGNSNAPVTIIGEQAGGLQVAIGGLPAGYAITTGDYFSFQDSAGKQQLHRAASDVVSDGTGATGWLDVVPAIRPGGLWSAPVRFAKPFMRAAIVPASAQLGQRVPMFTAGLSLSFRQDLRA